MLAESDNVARLMRDLVKFYWSYVATERPLGRFNGARVSMEEEGGGRSNGTGERSMDGVEGKIRK